MKIWIRKGRPVQGPPIFSFPVSSLWWCCFVLALFHIAHLGDHSVSTGSIFIPSYGCIDYRWRRTVVCFTSPLWMVVYLVSDLSVAASAAVKTCTYIISHVRISVGRWLHMELLEHMDNSLKLPLPGLRVYTPPQPLQIITLWPWQSQGWKWYLSVVLLYASSMMSEGKCLLICVRAINFSFSHWFCWCHCPFFYWAFIFFLVKYWEDLDITFGLGSE